MNKEHYPMTRVNSHMEIDLTLGDSSLLKGLKCPYRTIKVRVGSVVYRLPRGADDPTPDEVIKLNGLYHDITSGRVARELSKIKMDEKKPAE